jgi:hypothetical protein
MAKVIPLRGLNKVLKNLNKEIKNTDKRAQSGLTAAALFLKGEAQKEAPVDLGNLRNSAFVTFPSGEISGAGTGFKGKYVGDLKAHHLSVTTESKGRVKSSKNPVAEVGFSAVYALAVHENPRSGKSGRAGAATSGNWKFLENPLKRNAKKIFDIIRERTRII